MPVTIAGDNVPDPFERLVRYARRNEQTVRRYDLGSPEPQNLVTVDDLARTRIIHSHIGGPTQQGHFLHVSGQVAQLLATIPLTAHLRDADPGVRDGLYDHALEVHDSFLAPGIRHGKVSKVLHLKRPHLFPILDVRIVRAYRTAAAKAAARYSTDNRYKLMYWAAVREDLLDPGNQRELAQLRATAAGHDDERVRLLTGLSDVRLLDILTWQKDL